MVDNLDCRFTFDVILIEIDIKQKIYCSINNVRKMFVGYCLILFLAIAL